MSDQPIFRRFSADRQEQIQQLLTYVQLLGLSGRDLVSIGQTLTRITVSADLKHKRSIARDLAAQARPVQDGVHVTRMFEWSGPTGHVHVFSRAGLDSGRARVVSYRDATKSKQLTSSRPGHGVSQLVIYLPGYARRTWMYNVLLNIHYGDLQHFAG
jgi:hypothetical protein